MKFIEPDIQHHFGGGVYAKETFIPADNGWFSTRTSLIICRCWLKAQLN